MAEDEHTAGPPELYRCDRSNLEHVGARAGRGAARPDCREAGCDHAGRLRGWGAIARSKRKCYLTGLHLELRLSIQGGEIIIWGSVPDGNPRLSSRFTAATPIMQRHVIAHPSRALVSMAGFGRAAVEQPEAYSRGCLPLNRRGHASSTSQGLCPLHPNRGPFDGTLHLHSWPLLPAPSGESLAGGDPTAGFGLSVSRLERADRRRMLRAQRRLPDPGRRGPHRQDRQQLCQDQLRHWPDAALLA